jgi:alpha-N-arabinofuranosidase
MTIRKTLAASVLALGLAGSAAAQNNGVSVTVDVDTSKPGPVIDRHIYGQFAEHLGRGIYEGIYVGKNSKIPNIDGYRTDVVNALKKIKVPVVRWPGGCFADLYDWKDGIGPQAKRPVRINTHWGGVTEDNSFGTNEYLNLMELIGADAYVSGNEGTMQPYDMMQWMEYMTSADKSTLTEMRRKSGRAKPWKVPYFGIGNEVWGCGGNMRGEYAADLNRRYSSFVFAPPGQTVIKVASGPTGSRADWLDFAETMMRDGGRIQALSFHYYTVPNQSMRPAPGANGAALVSPTDGGATQPRQRRAPAANDPNAPTPGARGPATGFNEPAWAVTLTKALAMNDFIVKLSAMMDKYDPRKSTFLSIDEFGTWFDQEPGSAPGSLYQQNTLRDAEVAALTLNIFHRHTDRVKMAAIAQMVNVLQAMILTDKGRMLLTPTYHVYDMYVPFQDATPYPATVTGPHYRLGDNDLPSVDVSAARGKDGKLYLALVNLDPNKPAHVVTNLSGAAAGRLLTGPAMDTHNTFEAPDAIHPVAFSSVSENGKVAFDLPAKSVAVVAVN